MSKELGLVLGPIVKRTSKGRMFRLLSLAKKVRQVCSDNIEHNYRSDFRYVNAPVFSTSSREHERQ